MDSPKISVIIPAYNKGKYVDKTLNSIVNQGYSNLEVIIQDGGSTDGTLDIIKIYAHKYPIIFKLESKKDKGQLDAINKGLKKANGEILAFINADDIYLPGTFSEVARLYLANPEAFWFVGRGRVINSDGREIAKIATWYKNLFLCINRKSLLLILNYLVQPSVFLTRSAWKKFGPFTGTPDFVTEYDLWLKLARNGMPVTTDKYLSAFRIESSTITKTMSQNLLTEDENIVGRYTKNFTVLFLHKLNNYGRRLIGGIV